MQMCVVLFFPSPTPFFPFISKYFFLLPYDRIKPEFSINLRGQVNGVVSKYLSLFREVEKRVPR